MLSASNTSKCSTGIMLNYSLLRMHFDLLVRKAIFINTGARSLRSILESISNKAMFEDPGSKPCEESVEVVLVDEEVVGTADTVGCGAKVLCGSSGLESISPPTGSTMTMEKKEAAAKEDLDSEA